jgi:hypothetical protein
MEAAGIAFEQALRNLEHRRAAEAIAADRTAGIGGVATDAPANAAS